MTGLRKIEDEKLRSQDPLGPEPQGAEGDSTESFNSKSFNARKSQEPIKNNATVTVIQPTSSYNNYNSTGSSNSELF